MCFCNGSLCGPLDGVPSQQRWKMDAASWTHAVNTTEYTLRFPRRSLLKEQQRRSSPLFLCGLCANRDRHIHTGSCSEAKLSEAQTFELWWTVNIWCGHVCHCAELSRYRSRWTLQRTSENKASRCLQVKPRKETWKHTLGNEKRKQLLQQLQNLQTLQSVEVPWVILDATTLWPLWKQISHLAPKGKHRATKALQWATNTELFNSI